MSAIHVERIYLDSTPSDSWDLGPDSHTLPIKRGLLFAAVMRPGADVIWIPQLWSEK